jgi:deoxyribonuclease-2
MTVGARDEHGQPVDWWFLYKVPRLAASAQGSAATGYEYVYYDPHAQKVAPSPNQLTDGRGALDLTLQSVFAQPSATTGWLLYNDEPPASAHRSVSSTLGHTKGVLAFDTASGTAFWLLHSWPKYPAPGVAGLPTPDFGQTFLCVSLTLDVARQIATQMRGCQQPEVYLPRLPKTLDTGDPLYALAQPMDPAVAGDSSVLEVATRGHMPFKVIAKNRHWGKDFWSDLVGPTLHADMDDETWIRGPIPPVLDSDHVHRTYDIKYIDLHPLGAPWAWPETKDHAKWGITLGTDWVCVGDLNRMISQDKRGGGTIAFRNTAVWSALKATESLVLPPGVTRAAAVAAITSTHGRRA